VAGEPLRRGLTLPQTLLYRVFYYRLKQVRRGLREGEKSELKVRRLSVREVGMVPKRPRHRPLVGRSGDEESAGNPFRRRPYQKPFRPFPG